MKATPPPPLPTNDELGRWFDDGGKVHAAEETPVEWLTRAIATDLAEQLEGFTEAEAADFSECLESEAPRVVTGPEVLDVLDFVAGKLTGFPIASVRAAKVAAAIRCRGLGASAPTCPPRKAGADA